MSGEKDLERLLSGLAPELVAGEVVFLTFEDARYGDHRELEPVAAVREAEGWTLVVPRSRADESGLSYESAFRAIALGVHSSLEAVGLTAAVATRLAERRISANVIAGYHHDHVFVQSEHAERALEALEELSEGR